MRYTINEFKDEYFFLSNFYEAKVEFEGIVYLNNEAAFQAQKCLNKEDRKQFANLNPSEAKKLGRSVVLHITIALYSSLIIFFKLGSNFDFILCFIHCARSANILSMSVYPFTDVSVAILSASFIAAIVSVLG